MKTPLPTPGESTDSHPCVVMVLYEDDTALQRTITACNRLAALLWQEADFKFHWWRTGFLADPDLAAGAAREAANADLFIVCSATEAEPSVHLRGWFQDWFQARAGSDRALVNLSAPHSPPLADRSSFEAFLRGICRQAKLDFLGTFPSAAEPA